MKENIITQLKYIEKSIHWIQRSLEGEKQKNAYRNMVDCRRRLNKKKFAIESNPAAAMYGESQVGKSYLISSLLSEDNKPFSIIDENNVVHNFIEEINPPGGGSESTSLVSRFATNYKPVNPRFPIKAILLSPADIILALCDSFYNDIKIVHELTLQTEQINEEIEKLKSDFQKRECQQNILGEDDILDIQDYFKGYLTKANAVFNSRFFDEISLLIPKIKPNEFKDVFSLLWNKEDNFSSLFAVLMSEYEKLNFSNTVYLPLESVLYKYGTLLDVKRLKEIYEEPDRIESEYKAETKVLCGEREITFSKSYLCALSAELVFSQPETLLQSKPFLRQTDLLDFPGARSRLNLPQNLIQPDSMPEFLLRGKVAYLFNKYSDAEKINVLLFCAKHEQAAQRAMPEMLNNWIEKIVGKTPEEREAFIKRSQIPPLFIIGTFFNVNLKFDPQKDKPGDNSSLNYRWNQRFERTLAAQMLNTEVYQWFENWTISNPSFQNIFLLRDFEKSDTISHIFKGYNEHKTELEEVVPKQYPDFKQKLRQSFIDYDFVKRHFVNPAESWDRAASINEDGTKLIIDKLTIAANNIEVARFEKTLTHLHDISQAILTELHKHFHSDDKDEELLHAKSVAGDIQHQLDIAFSADNIKLYGPMMKELMLDESSVLELFRKKIDDMEHRDIVNMDIYSTYRIQVPVIENDTAAAYFERLCIHYEKTTEEQKQKFAADLEARQVNLEELIKGNSDLIKNNAQQLAEALLDYWAAYIAMNDKQTIRQVFAEGSTALQEITDMFRKLFKKLGIARRIAEKIRRYVDGHSKTDLPYEIVADISTELLNKCINTVGFEYLDEAEVNGLREANRLNNLGLNLNQYADPAEKSLDELFHKIENRSDIMQANPEEMKSLPNYRNYLAWYNRLKTGFVHVCDIPTYDPVANKELSGIIQECETIKY